MKATTREWLNLTWADTCVNVAGVLLIAMFFVGNARADAVLAVLSVALTVLACPLGMRRRDDLPDWMNALKKLIFPGCVVLILLGVLFHYTLWPYAQAVIRHVFFGGPEPIWP